MRAGVAQLQQVSGLRVGLDDQAVMVEHQFSDRRAVEQGRKARQRRLGLSLALAQFLVLYLQLGLVDAQVFDQAFERQLFVL
jgi:hypothetical protein